MKENMYSSTSLRNKTLLYSFRELSHIMQIIFNDTIITLELVFSLIKKSSGNLHVLLTNAFIFLSIIS